MSLLRLVTDEMRDIANYNPNVSDVIEGTIGRIRRKRLRWVEEPLEAAAETPDQAYSVWTDKGEYCPYYSTRDCEDIELSWPVPTLDEAKALCQAHADADWESLAEVAP